MMVRQISRKEALELAARGCEVLMMGPTTEEPGGWEDYEPGTLDRLLDGCLFFREVPALEKDLFQEVTETPPAEPATESRDGSRQDTAETEGSAKKEGQGRRVKVDTGKLMALHNAGWSNIKIGQELGISEFTVRKYLKQMKEETDAGDE
ncbi:MAG: response regulator transcription factor [Lachnospiraceae bacterium]|jgi:hypothetical protein|nr:response regulator transcription factor [Lachnospiraceae bacterium]